MKEYFESMRASPRGIFLWQYHARRIVETVTKMFPIAKVSEIGLPTADEIVTELTEIKMVKMIYSCSAAFEYKTEIHSMPEIKQGLNLGLSPYIKLFSEEGRYKSTERKLYLDSLAFAKENGLDETLICNPSGHVIESAIANLFWVKGDVFYTPPLEDGEIGGVFRSFLMEHFRQNEISCVEESISVAGLGEVDELFLVNAVRGIRSVARFQHVLFSTDKTQTLRCEIENELRS